MKKNVKLIASLVRKAKRKLQQNKRDEALEIMRKAVSVDDNNGVLVQIIQVIGKKKSAAEPEEEPLVTPEVPVVEQAELESVEELDEAWEVDQAEPESVTIYNQERKTSMASENQLTELFEASDREYNNGHHQKAIAFLKSARELDPDSEEVQLRVNLLRTKIESADFLQLARKKLDSGEPAQAVVLIREAFNIRPDISGLDELLSDIENSPEIPSSTSADSGSGGAESTSSEGYITRVRQLVQDNSLEEAASLAEEAFNLFPDDALVVEFVDNFKKLGLLE